MPRKKKEQEATPPAEAPDAELPNAEALAAETAAETIAPSRVDHVPLFRLARAPENVRRANEQVDVDELADDIAGHGLLQSLIGYIGEEGHATTSAGPFVFICGGGRRLHALQRLREAGRVGDDYEVPVQIRPREQAIEISLAENLARRDMNPADQFRGFKQLIDGSGGKVGPADIARRFGYGLDFVRQRMRLADLHVEILDALAEGRITLDAAMAYAGTQDLDVQLRIFKGQEKATWRPHDPDTIKREVRGETYTSTSRLVRYIGLDAYERAGGSYEDDLFLAAEPWEKPGIRRLANIALVRSLAREKAESELPALVERHRLAGAVLTFDNNYSEPKLPKAPKGFAKVERSYNHTHEEWREVRERAIDAGVEVQGIAYVVEVREASALQIYDRAFFVPKGKVAEIVPPVEERGGYHSPTPEEREAAEREREVTISAARAAVPPFAGGPLDGRVFWSRNYWSVRNTTDDHPLGQGCLVDAEIFVPAADVEAQRAEAERRYDEAKAAKARAEAEAEAARIAAAETWQQRKAKLLAEPPAVIRLDEEPFDFFRHEDGSWPDVRPGQPEEEAEFGFETLEELLDHADAIESPVLSWPTIEAFDAAVANGEAFVAGRCRICGCVESHACDLGDGVPCSWADQTRTLCDNPACAAAASGADEKGGAAEPEREAAE
jgi:ParB family transcriptional regulator, chromosome partitioning protein